MDEERMLAILLMSAALGLERMEEVRRTHPYSIPAPLYARQARVLVQEREARNTAMGLLHNIGLREREAAKGTMH